MLDKREMRSARSFVSPGINSEDRPNLLFNKNVENSRPKALPAIVETENFLVQDNVDVLSENILMMGYG